LPSTSCALPAGSLWQAGRGGRKTIHFFDELGKFCITMGVSPAPERALPRAIDRWIRRERSRAPLKAKSLVVTVWGDAIAPHGGAVWLSGLIRLLAPLGLNERLVRTSVYRLAREGWLEAQADGRRSLYRLTARGLARFEHAYRRIYARPATDWDGSWVVVLAPAAGLSPEERRGLRKELGWEGFGVLAPGVFLRPAGAATQDAVGTILTQLRLQRRVAVVTGQEAPRLAARSLAAYRGDCWNLEGVAAEYRRFLARFATVSGSFGRDGSVDPERCFVVRSLLIHAFRRVTLAGGGGIYTVSRFLPPDPEERGAASALDALNPGRVSAAGGRVFLPPFRGPQARVRGRARACASLTRARGFRRLLRRSRRGSRRPGTSR
jgi:phenylacetic acid degradation operon negative regulatory protein